MTTLTRSMRYALWVMNGYIGKSVSARTSHTATVLITYYHPARMQHIEPQVRNILKCNFVDRLVISNHNPEIRIDDMLKIRDSRLVLVNQHVRRGCGYRWIVADAFNPEYLIMVDDDMLFFPVQLARLFAHLVDYPEIPHGVAGMLQHDNAVLEYHERQDMVVDFLCETYAVTGRHLRRYLELRKLVATDATRSQMVDEAADFMLISQTGDRNPEIHDVGRLFKSLTFKEAGIAVHKNDGFSESLLEVSQALRRIGQPV